jgi:hypothetical protein
LSTGDKDAARLDADAAADDLYPMENVTITLDDETLAWVRVEAAKAGQSVSQWISGRLRSMSRDHAERAAASHRIEAFLEQGPRFALSENGKITIDRDALHDDGRFSRFDCAN